jgi:tryptophan synthase alpha chain
MNRIDKLFQTKKEKILSVYFTAGYPSPDSAEEIILLLEKNGADMVEIGIPYSDPLADGPVIQETSKSAIENGMTIKILFKQLKDIRKKCTIPLLLMGYINPILQFGFNSFCQNAAENGIDGIIIPDLPLSEYEKNYKMITERYNLKNIFLITSNTSEDRIREIDALSTGFIYLVSSASTTGKSEAFGEPQLNYFRRIASMGLKNPALAGFGIYNQETLAQVHRYLPGAIIGSAYLRSLKSNNSIKEDTARFFRSLNINKDIFPADF